jgi:hypothetical protein
MNKFCGGCGNFVPIVSGNICEGCEIAIVVKNQMLEMMLGGNRERSDASTN